MILGRCEKLRRRIAEKKQLEQSVKQILRFRKVRDLLAQQSNRLAPLPAMSRTLREARIFEEGAPDEVATALAAVDSAREGFQVRAESVIDEHSFSPLAFGQALSSAADALDSLLSAAWQRHAAAKVPPTNREVLDALAPAFPREVRVIRQAGEKLGRLRQVLPKSRQQLQEFEDEVGALQRVWGQLGGGDLPGPVLSFLKGAAAPAGAGLDLLTDEVRRWLTEHGIIHSFSIRATGPEQ